jgi:site-specific DNA-methyltransferase (adenine-specific)
MKNRRSLFRGNCLWALGTLKEGSVDACISDIPYGISFSSWDIKHTNTNRALLGKSPAQESSLLFKTRGKPLNGWSQSDKLIGIEYQASH